MNAVKTAVAILALLPLFACSGETPGPASGGTPAQSAAGPFVDRTDQVGLDFFYFNGMSGEFHLAEILGPGGALFDYDGDGDLDAFIVQGGRFDPALDPDAARIGRRMQPLNDRLFRNELSETGTLAFVDATAGSGIDGTGYGMGAAIGDYDGDGDPDLYVTNYAENRLWRNDGDGGFTDVTDAANAGDPRWSTSAAFLDYDGDGALDLFVVNYVNYTLANHKPCYSPTSALDYCIPDNFAPLPDRLLHNRGDGTFEDVTAAAGIAGRYGAGLGVVSGDFDRDGRIDIYVANDGNPNQLWLNRGGGRFEDRALIAGCALNADGRAEGSMGIDAADFDGDGDEDLFMTHLTDETNTLYLNDGTGLFEDLSLATAVATASRPYTGFGTAFADYDNDGWLDLIVANGAVRTQPELARAGDPFPLHQKNQIFRNRGDGTFEEVTASAGAAFETSEVSRGAAFGDVDNDGDVDLLVLNNNAPSRLLLNRVGQDSPWIGLRVLGRDGRRDAIDARVELLLEDGSTIWRRVRAAASYCSSNDPRVLVGLRGRAPVAALRVHWLDGGDETWDAPPMGEYTTLRRGEGRSAD
ncbi:MAG: CRTAC1 family protein [bacterium]|nr:CRTAC1 family protein [bacterium]